MDLNLVEASVHFHKDAPTNNAVFDRGVASICAENSLALTLSSHFSMPTRMLKGVGVQKVSSVSFI